MTRHTLKSVFMGSAMCLMLLGMLHRQLTSVDAVGFIALGFFCWRTRACSSSCARSSAVGSHA